MAENPNRMDHIIDPTQNTHIFEPGMTTSDVYDVALITKNYFKTLCRRRIYPQVTDRRVKKCEECYEVAMAIVNQST